MYNQDYVNVDGTRLLYYEHFTNSKWLYNFRLFYSSLFTFLKPCIILQLCWMSILGLEFIAQTLAWLVKYVTEAGMICWNPQGYCFCLFPKTKRRTIFKTAKQFTGLLRFQEERISWDILQELWKAWGVETIRTENSHLIWS